MIQEINTYAVPLLTYACGIIPWTYIHTYIHIHIHSQIHHPHKSDWTLNSSWKELNCNM